MKKPPFEMSPERTAEVRWPGSRRIVGKASHVWVHSALAAVALGAQNVEVRRRKPIGPWHKLTLTEDEAYEALQQCEPLKPGVRAAIESHRSRQELD